MGTPLDWDNYGKMESIETYVGIVALTHLCLLIDN